MFIKEFELKFLFWGVLMFMGGGEVGVVVGTYYFTFCDEDMLIGCVVVGGIYIFMCV